MKNFQLQKQLIVAGLVILLLADAALGFYVMRMRDARQNPDAVLATESRQVSLVKADIQRASEIQKKIPASLRKLDEFEGSLAPAASGYSAISQELTEVAVKNHINIDDEKFHTKEISGRNLTEIEIDTSVSGEYAAIVRFLNALQRSKSVYIVDSLQVDSPNSIPGQPASGILKVSLHLRTYFRKS